MIDEVRVRDVALIRDATLNPAPGLTVLTGETGAGKTALLSALKLLVGDRADAGSVREGCDALEVEGRFYLGEDDAEGHVVRRRVGADGRGRVEMDGRMASVRELAEDVGSTVDLCGQHEHQRLLSVSSHVEILDEWTGESAREALSAWHDALAVARAARDELDRARELSGSAQEKVDEAAFVVRRIDEVDPRADEYAQLELELPRVEHAEALMRAAETAHEAISGDDGAADLLSRAVSALRDASAYDPSLARHADAVEGALIDVEDVAGDLRDYRDAVDFDPGALDQMQSRMAQLQGLMRTYGPSMEDVLARRDAARELVEAAGDSGERVRLAERALSQAEKDLARAGDVLDAVRAEAAPRLAAAVGTQMARLEMGGAELEVTIERLARSEWSNAGPSRVEFLYRPAAGLTARPLRRIASGGEVSRVMLACKVVLGASDQVDTLVFDEVDAGVGGATAVALASVLASLAKTHQVIVVTHLAQVAVVAARHFLVSKEGAETPETTIREVAGDDRVREVARMLSGDASDASLAHAREMLSVREA